MINTKLKINVTNDVEIVNIIITTMLDDYYFYFMFEIYYGRYVGIFFKYIIEFYYHTYIIYIYVKK